MTYLRFPTNSRHGVRVMAITLLTAFSLTACVVNLPTAGQAPAANQPEAGQAPEAPSIRKTNINTASEADLLKIPGIGEKMVDEILEYRPFTNVEHFRKEIGKYVDADQLTEYEKYIVIDSN